MGRRELMLPWLRRDDLWQECFEVFVDGSATGAWRIKSTCVAAFAMIWLHRK